VKSYFRRESITLGIANTFTSANSRRICFFFHRKCWIFI